MAVRHALIRLNLADQQLGVSVTTKVPDPSEQIPTVNPSKFLKYENSIYGIKCNILLIGALKVLAIHLLWKCSFHKETMQVTSFLMILMP
jgi:hypothetical protein